MSKIKLPTGLCSDESSLPGLHTAAFLLCGHMTFLPGTCSPGVSVLQGHWSCGLGPQPYDLI